MKLPRSPGFALALFSFLLVSALSFAEEQEDEVLTIEQAKFQMVQLYLASEVPPKKLRTKYPELRKLDKASRVAGKELRAAIQAHPKLQPRFAEIEALEISISEKAKLWKPLFIEAEGIADLEAARKKYDAARIHALQEELKALKAEGYEELAGKLEGVFKRIGVAKAATEK